MEEELEDTALVATCQSQGSHARQHTLLYHLLHFKLEHHLQNEHHAVLKKTCENITS